MSVEAASGSPLQGALVMGASFGLGAVAPIAPYLVLALNVALPISLAATAAVLFAIGAAKARWTDGNPLFSGLESLAVGAFAGITGYVFGSILPALFGVPASP